MGKILESSKGETLARALLLGPINSDAQESTLSSLAEGGLNVLPIIAMDFSQANLTFSEEQCLHSTKPYKKCDYRDVLRSICSSFANVTALPIYGYSAKTSAQSAEVSQVFPLSRDLRNPFIFNAPISVTEQYTNCLKELELGLPINLSEFFKLVKRLIISCS